MYSRAREFWDGQILDGIDNSLKHFFKSSKETKQARYISYACIYVYMNISKPLLDSIDIYDQDEFQKKTLEFEYISFMEEDGINMATSTGIFPLLILNLAEKPPNSLIKMASLNW